MKFHRIWMVALLVFALVAGPSSMAVGAVKVTGVELDVEWFELMLGEIYELDATLTPKTATTKSLKWKSSDVKVATIDARGNVKAVGDGSAKITVTTTDGGYTDYAVVMVIMPVQKLTLNKAKVNVTVGDTEKLQVTVSPSTARNKQVYWVSDNEKVATVDQAGNVRGLKAGSTTVTVFSEDGGFESTATVTVTKPVSVTGVKLNQSSATMKLKAKSMKLEPTVSPALATNRAVTWKSSDSKVATVSASGVVQFLKVGTAQITVTTVDGTKSATCKVTIVK